MGQYHNDAPAFEALTNPGWDPRCCLTAEGFRYSMPGRLRVQIDGLQIDAASTHGGYETELKRLVLVRLARHAVALPGEPVGVGLAVLLAAQLQEHRHHPVAQPQR